MKIFSQTYIVENNSPRDLSYLYVNVIEESEQFFFKEFYQYEIKIMFARQVSMRPKEPKEKFSDNCINISIKTSW